MTHYLITMKDGWKPAMCPDCHIQYSGCVGVCGVFQCPLEGAREAVHYQSLPGGIETFVVETKEKN